MRRVYLSNLNATFAGELDFVSAEFSPDGNFLVVFLRPLSIFGYTDPRAQEPIFVYQLHCLQSPRVLQNHTNWISDVAFLSSSRLLSFGNDATLRLSDLSSGKYASVDYLFILLYVF